MQRSLRSAVRTASALALAAAWALAQAPRASATAMTPRYAHVAAIMVDGRTIVAGGIDTTGGALQSVEILDTMHGSDFYSNVANEQSIYASSMSVARASATITVLPNGNILVAGGWNGAALASAEVYSPGGNSWTSATNAMSSGRYNHTASLLNTGNVLVCGGETGSGVAATAATATCDLFIPSGASGSFSPTGALLLARAHHTATVLRDGTVWIAGGWNPDPGANPNGAFVVTTERYNPATGLWQQAQPLNAARQNHTATLTGDNKVVVAGGFNGRDVTDALGFKSHGFLATSEIFDPVGGAIVPGPPLNARVTKQSAVLEPAGDVTIFGGLGNIPGTKLTASAVPTTLSASANVTGVAAAGVGKQTSTGGSGQVSLGFTLGTNASGQIMSGEVQFTNPLLSGSGLSVTFVSADPNNTTIGLRGSLDGATVGCDPINLICGQVNTTLNLQNMGQGTYSFTTEPTPVSQLAANTSVSGTLYLSPNTVKQSVGGGNALIGTYPSPSSVSVHAQLAVPSVTAGFTISNVQCTLNPSSVMSWQENSSYTATLTGGTASPAGTFPVITAAGLSYIDINPLTFSNVTGTFALASSDPNYQLSSSPSGLAIPVSGTSPLGSMTCQMTFNSSGVDVGGLTLKYDSYYAVISSMTFSDKEFYNPSQNSWSFIPPGGSDYRPKASYLPALEGPVTIMTPQDDLYDIGGRALVGTALAPAQWPSAAQRAETSLLFAPTGFTVGGTLDPLVHAFHSATLLTDGTILLAGGTDGSYVLDSGELFSPASGGFLSTNNLMNTPREKHSATLMTNGRVLLAGGFATTAVSTGPTNTAEVYYPDTRLFLQTSVMFSSHSQHAAVGLPNGDVFIAGGYNNNTSVTNVAEIYSSTSGSWWQAASIPAGYQRAIAPAVQLQDGRILMCGGTNQSGILSSCIAYNPANNTWDTTIAAMPSPLQSHTMTAMPDGRVLVAGGDDGFGETSSSYLYNPALNGWSTLNPLKTARFGHNAVLMPNNTVMISGGVQQSNVGPGNTTNALQTNEFYHPAIAAWTDGAGGSKFTVGPRAFHTVTLTPTGQVYIFGGANGSIGAGQNLAFYNKYESVYFGDGPDSVAQIQPSQRQSVISTTTASPFLPGINFTATGLRFRGGTEASGGAGGSGNPSLNYPRLILQKIEGSGGSGAECSPGFAADLTTKIPTVPGNLSTLDTSLTVPLPATSAGLPYGWYGAWVTNNGLGSQQAPMVQVGPPLPDQPVSNVTVNTLGVSSITYTWTTLPASWVPPTCVAPHCIDGFSVYSATSGVFLTTMPVATPSFTQTNLLPNTTAGIIVAGYTLSGDGPLVHSATAYTLAGVPTNVTIASVTFNTLLLQWNPNQNLPGVIYEIGESSDNFVSSFSTPVPNILALTNNYATISQLLPNTTYYFRVRAYNTAGLASNWSVAASTLTRTNVAGVVGVAVNPTSIQWNWIPAGTVNNYNVYDTTSGIRLAQTASNSFLDTGLGVNTQRSIMVSAVTAAGEGPLSAAASAYTLAATPVPVPPALTGLTTGSFTVQWAPNGNPNGTIYDLNLYNFGSIANIPAISSANTTGFFFSWGGLPPSTQFAAFVYPVNGDGILGPPLFFGSTLTFATPPVNLQVLGTTPISITTSWNTNSNSTSTYYQLTYSNDNFVTNIATSVPFSALFNGSSATITGLLTSTTYWIRVQAENAYGQLTQFSNVASTITFNGGAPPGSLAGTILANAVSDFSGNLANGRAVDLRSPGGSFPTDTVVTISSLDATVPLCAGGLNVAFSITPNPFLQPRAPLYLTSSYVPADIGTSPTGQIALERFDPVSGTCVPLATTFDTVNRQFRAQINHFSSYELVVVPLATDTGSARIFPNPYKAATDDYITFDQIPPASRVRVMTLRGETVLDATANGAGLLTWNASNGAGRSVASGLYIAVIESGSSKKILKLAVIR